MDASMAAGSDGTAAGTPLLPGDTHLVVERYESMVYGIALTHTSCRGDADDVFQDVFLAYHRRQPPCRSEEHRKAWLITTTLNCARKVAGSSWRTRVVPLTPQDAERIPEQFRFASDEQNVLFKALRSLPENYRTVLHLFYFEDLSIAGIAALLGLEAGAVKMRLSRGRALMRDQLQGGLFDE
ncbi:MAG: sigma-70 family RNA polymerase sigma factor [Propionicimonas sp.]|uniref:RNA polymerase sigma factor n=1 Tax=Propionicimonas sp. TaxID=1955623 RepID=UPI002B203891|nr:sigma-70 family RNA polymerase sigma factor [Propionicimonas sp.]MEA4944312.1 sigma-70 family RNA polymerase sigma factor [Propionicimonas sp.]